MNDISKRYKYLLDKEAFIDTWDNNRKTAAEKIRRMAIKEMGPEKADALLEGLRLTGILSDSLKQTKPSPVQLIKQVYQNLGPKLRCKVMCMNGFDYILKLNSKNEYEALLELDKDTFVTMLAQSPEALEYLTQAINQDRLLMTRYNEKSLAEALYSEFKMDSEIRLSEMPPLLSVTPGVAAFKNVDPSNIVPGPHPSWDSFCSRLDFPETFKAYVWSIFVPSNFGRQALWMQGEGNDGKSSVLNALAKYMGPNHTLTINQGTLDSDFFFGDVFGKRLAIYSDCMNLKLLRKEKIKSVLGRDTVSVNKKRLAAFSAQIYCKLLVGSNFFPQINYNDASERTRLLLIRVRQYNSEFGDPDFESNLEAELPHFLHHCQAFYAAECPKGMGLRIPEAMANNIKVLCGAADSDLLEQFIYEHLEFQPKFYVRKTDLNLAVKEHFARFASMREMGLSIEDLARLLSKRNCRFDKIDGAPCFVGVRLKGTKYELTL